jgi:aspartate-semialdehyde dehydrogenase
MIRTLHNSKKKVAVFGATGNVGQRTVALLLEKKLVDPSDLLLFASRPRNATFGSYVLPVQAASQTPWDDLFLCIFNTEADVSCTLIPHALRTGKTYVLDSSSLFRMDKEVPLIVPGVNDPLVCLEKKLYAHANCIVSPLALVLWVLHQIHPLQVVTVSTYQSTSGAGYAAQEACFQETKDVVERREPHAKYFSRPIAFNIIPQIGHLNAAGERVGESSEEEKIRLEVYKVLELQEAQISIRATAVRVPVMIGHCMALTVDFQDDVCLASFEKTLMHNTNLIFQKTDLYATPLDVVGKEKVYLGRLRQAGPKTLQMWIASDNLLRGAASDTVAIAQRILRLDSAIRA